MFSLIANTLLPLILCISIGAISKKLDYLDQAFWHKLDLLNYYLLFPSLLFFSLATAQVEFSQLTSTLTTLIGSLSILIVLFFIAKFCFKIPAYNFGVYFQANVRFSTYIGLALVSSLFHTQGLTIFSLILAIAIPLLNVFAVLSLIDFAQTSIKSITLSLIKNPAIIACSAGILFKFSDFTLIEGTQSVLKMLANTSLPLGLMTIGAGLQFSLSKNDAGKIVLNSLSRLLLLPLVIYFTFSYVLYQQSFSIFDINIQLSLLELQILTLFFALPTAPTAYILTKILGGNHGLMVNIISLQTLLSSLTIPVILLLIL